MESRSLVSRFLLFCVLLAAGAAAAEDEFRRDTTGLYPIWENTGHIEKGVDVRIGTTGGRVGIFDVAHVGGQPSSFIYRTLSGYLKVSRASAGGWRLAGQAGALRRLA